jgi:hypothetical protein
LAASLLSKLFLTTFNSIRWGEPLPPDKKDPEIAALEAVHAALKPLDPQARRKVLTSVHALLDIAQPEGLQVQTSVTEPGTAARSVPQASLARPTTRPLSLVELMQDKHPRTSAQKITLFAYYREKYEGTPRFARENLNDYFSKAKERPPANFDRDFVDAVKKGWLHEAESESYITTKGIEAVELGFPSEGTGSKVVRRPSKQKKGSKRHR